MTMQPGAAADPLTIRLYDKIEEMRSDVASMASDVRNLATTIQPVVMQVGDHETRIRDAERTIEPMKDHEERIKGLEEAVGPIADHKTRLPAVERKVWMAAGAVGLIVGGASVAATLLAGAGR